MVPATACARISHGLREELAELQHFDTSILQRADESVMLLTSALEPQNVVKQEVVAVFRKPEQPDRLTMCQDSGCSANAMQADLVQPYGDCKEQPRWHGRG